MGIVALVALLGRPVPAGANCHIATWDTNRVRVREDAGSAELFVELDGRGDVTCTGSVKWETHDRSAVAPGDYTASKGEFSWKPGDARRRTVKIPIVDDGDRESGEVFDVTMTAGPGGIQVEEVGPGEGGPTVAVFINDNDNPSASASPVPTQEEEPDEVPAGSKGSGAIVGILVAVVVLGTAGGIWLRRSGAARARKRSANSRRRRKR